MTQRNQFDNHLLFLQDFDGSLPGGISAWCREHGVSRSTVYRWMEQWECPVCGGSGRGVPTLQEPDGAEEGCVRCGHTTETDTSFIQAEVDKLAERLAANHAKLHPAESGS